MLIPAVLASSFLVSGIVFGWAPLLLILRSDGTVDAVGESSLTLAYTCGVAAQTGMALVAGTLADLQGPKVTSAIGTALVSLTPLPPSRAESSRSGLYRAGVVRCGAKLSDGAGWVHVHRRGCVHQLLCVLCSCVHRPF